LEGQPLVVSGTSKCVLLLLLHWDVVPHEYIISDIYRSSHMNMNALGLVSSYDRKRRENHQCWCVTLHSPDDTHVTSF
jgi:hypothetical protein